MEAVKKITVLLLVASIVGFTAEPSAIQKREPDLWKVIMQMLDHGESEAVKNHDTHSTMTAWVSFAYRDRFMEAYALNVEGVPGSMGPSGKEAEKIGPKEVHAARLELERNLRDIMGYAMNKCRSAYSWDSSCLDIEFGINYLNWLEHKRPKIYPGNCFPLGGNSFFAGSEGNPHAHSIRELYHMVNLWGLINVEGVI